MALKQKDDFAGAEAELRQARSRSIPRCREASYTLGVVLWQTGRRRGGRGGLPGRHRRASRTTPRPTTCSAPSCKQQGDLRRGARRAPRGHPAAAATAPEAHLGLGPAAAAEGRRGGRAGGVRGGERLQRKKADAQAARVRAERGPARSSNAATRPAAIEGFREAVRLDPANARGPLPARRCALERAGAARRGADAHFAEARRLAPWLRGPEPRR